MAKQTVTNELGLDVIIPDDCSAFDRTIWQYPLSCLLYRGAILGLISEGCVFEYMNIFDGNVQTQIAEAATALHEYAAVFPDSCLLASKTILCVSELFDVKDAIFRSIRLENDEYVFEVVRSNDKDGNLKKFECPGGLLGSDVAQRFNDETVRMLTVSFKNSNDFIFIRASEKLRFVIERNVFDEIILTNCLTRIDPESVDRTNRINEALSLSSHRGKGPGR